MWLLSRGKSWENHRLSRDGKEHYALKQAESRYPETEPSPDQLEIQRLAYPEVTGRRYNAAPDRVLAAVSNVVAANGWPVRSRNGVIAEGDDVTLEVRAWSPVFAFPADVVIRIGDEGETTYVDMRSSSVYAAHDLGDNARRIATFMKALDAEMLLLAGT